MAVNVEDKSGEHYGPTPSSVYAIHLGMWYVYVYVVCGMWYVYVYVYGMCMWYVYTQGV